MLRSCFLCYNSATGCDNTLHLNNDYGSSQMPNNILAQKDLKEALQYDSETGLFTRIKSHSNSSKKTGENYTHNDEGYIRIFVCGKLYYAHRLAWLYIYGEFPKHQIDHINHIKDDNRMINLRKATSRENKKNAPLRKDNKSGVVGVCIHKRSQKWSAEIKVNGKKVHLGLFEHKVDAAKTRKEAEIKYGFHENHGT